MQSTIEHIEDIISKTGEIIDTKTELIKLKAAGKVSEIISSLISITAIVTLVGVAAAILSIGVAYSIGKSLGSIAYGFFIVGGFYVVLAIIIYFFREDIIKKPLNNIIIDKIIE